jgi:hypothetical protein
MCVALPIALLPLYLSYNMGMITKKDMEYSSLEAGEMCARTLLTMIPFVNLKVSGDGDDKEPEPSIWVLNHTSMLDAFMLLAADQKLRGKHKRPIKFVYVSVLSSLPTTYPCYLELSRTSNTCLSFCVYGFLFLITNILALSLVEGFGGQPRYKNIVSNVWIYSGADGGECSGCVE